jgi:hypothetical protein
MRRIFGFIALICVAAMLIVRVNQLGFWKKTNSNSSISSPQLPDSLSRSRDTNAPLIFDSFTKNQGWEVVNTAELRKAVENGHYRFDNKSADNIYYSVRPMKLTDDDDFTLEATFSKVKGQDVDTFGLVWGSDGKDGYFIFGIADNGRYAAFRKKNDWEPLVPFTDSEEVNKPNKMNVLRLTKKGFKINLYINNHLVNSFSHQAFFGNQMGVYVDSGMTLDIDNFKVTKDAKAFN